MTGIIDTSSLLAIARYYLPYSSDDYLLRFLEAAFINGDVVLLSTILSEARYTQKGLALSSLPFLDNVSFVVNDEDLLPPAPRRFSNQIDHNFCIPLMKKRLTDEQYALQKEVYMKTGDMRMILYALNHPDSDPVIITEETPSHNDGKLFKKLPIICDFLGIRHMSAPQWLSSHGLSLSWVPVH